MVSLISVSFVSDRFRFVLIAPQTYPLDRAKTAYQRASLEQGKRFPTNIPPVEYFCRASYQGMAVSATRSALTNAILFTAFELVKQRINALPDPEEEPRPKRR